MNLREDQKYNLTSSENEAWIVGRGYGATTLLSEAMKEVTSVGGNVLLVCPIGSCLKYTGQPLPVKQGIYPLGNGSVTYIKGFMNVDPNEFDLILIDHIFHLDIHHQFHKWRDLTISNTKVILAGTPSEGNIETGSLEINAFVKREVDCFYKVHSGSTFHNTGLPESFLKCVLEERSSCVSRFKRETLGIC